MAVAAVVFVAAAPAAADDAPAAQDCIPQNWAAVNISWAATWDATLEANSDAVLGKQIAADATLNSVAGEALALRKIALLKAMAQRFPAEKQKHIEAYLQMAAAGGELRDFCLQQIVREFPAQPDLAAKAYAALIAQPFKDSVRRPSALQWQSMPEKVLAFNARGGIADSSPVVAAALARQGELIGAQMRYDLAPAFFAHAARLAKANPAAAAAAGELLAYLGHGKLAGDWFEKARDNRANVLSIQVGRGVLAALPRDVDLQMRWEALMRSRSATEDFDTADLSNLLEAAAKSQATVARSESHYQSFARAVDQELLTHGGQLTALRQAQDRVAGNLAAELAREDARDELLKLFRRCPWSAGVHEAMAGLAENALRSGHYQWAAATFADVASHAAADNLRRWASVGFWTAVAAQGDAGALEAVMAGAAPDARLPWRGAEATASQIKKELLLGCRGVRSAPPAPLDASRLAISQLPRRRITLPAAPAGWNAGEEAWDMAPHAPWPAVWVADRGPEIIAATSEGVTLLAGDGSSRWTRTVPAAAAPAVRAANEEPAVTHPPRFWPLRQRGAAMTSLPAGPGEKQAVICCLMNQTLPQSLAGLDAADGSVVWSSAALADWKGLRVLSYPAIFDGRAYVLAASAEAQTPMLSLVCAEAVDGRIVWRRTIGRAVDVPVELARASGEVTVSQGSVYSVTHAGSIARCDLRDGSLEWVRGYASAVQQARPAMQFSRSGRGPIVSGTTLLAAPRDHSGVLALDCRSGAILWEAPMTPSDRMLGVVDGVLITMASRWLAGVDVAGGGVKWCRPFERDIDAAAIRGGEVIVVAGERFYRVAADTGKTIEEASIDGQAETPMQGRGLSHGNAHATQPAVQRVFLGDGSLLEIAAPAFAAAQAAPVAIPARLSLPLAQAWSAAAPQATVIVPPPGQADDRFYVISGRRLACLSARENAPSSVQTLWECVLPAAAQRGRVAGGKVLVSGGSDVTAIDAAGGKVLWSATLPFWAEHLDVGGAVAAAASAGGEWEPWAAAIDMASGRLLWTCCLGRSIRVGNQSIKSIAVGAGGEVNVYASALFSGEGGAVPAQIVFDAAGGMKDIRRILPKEKAWPRHYDLADQTICYVAATSTAREAALADQRPLSPWQRPLETSRFYKTPVDLLIKTSPGGSFATCMEKVYAFDRAAGRETLYELPAGPTAWNCVVVEAAHCGDVTAVASFLHGRYLRKNDRTPETRWAMFSTSKPALYIDLFDRASGRHLARQELPGVTFEEETAQVKILNRMIVVADAQSVQVFAAKQ
ncbi:MAG: PQQ-like beta-propeller repeat protein [Planctomycetaceae bacterium]|nr:PQQ-like beta-propeller repeat protein [Planctomycetaceae bacterium]